MIGELLICIYNLILHQATFDAGASTNTSDGGVSGAGAGDAVAAVDTTTLRFIIASNLANGVTCLVLFAAVPALRQHADGMATVSRKFLMVSLTGECLSMTGVVLATYS